MSSPRITLAPLRGITGFAFRTAYARHFAGLDEALAPFVPTMRGKAIRPTALRDVLPENNRLLPVVPQILGNDPAAFLTLAHALADRGYEEVNWNLGCPFVKVTAKGRGAGLLRHPDRVAAILDAVVPRLSIGLSVKTRLGYASVDELAPLMPVLNRYPLRRLIVHARTAAQGYTGAVDLDAFGRILPLAAAQVTYNGSIETAEDWAYCAERFPAVHEWMVGRGLLADPFLPLRIRGAAVTDEVAGIRAFHYDLVEAYLSSLPGPVAVLGAMKELWQFLAPSFDDGASWLIRIRRSKEIGAYRRTVEALLDGSTRWCPPQGLRIVASPQQGGED